MKGLDTNRNCTDLASCLKQSGIDFVARYYSRTTKNADKRLTLAEAQALSQAGLYLVTVYEDSPTSKDYFSSDRGKSDGKSAYAYAQDINQPRDSAIYFAVDYDATMADIEGPIIQYFNGVYDGLKDSANAKPIYKIGVYGSGATCDYLRKNLSFVEFSWLSCSTGWLNSKTYSNWNIKQSLATTSLCGLDKTAWDSNESQSNFGQFTLQPAQLTNNLPTNQPNQIPITNTGFLNASTGTLNRLLLTQTGVVGSIVATVGAFIKAEPVVSAVIIIIALLGITWLISFYIYLEYSLDCQRIDIAADPNKHNVT
ncbi:MAG: DUF1906 domain-containing protein [Acidobacteria bacterium]|nr:DUF1906 domain-containing protein [Acidobacteriota bacterium]